MKKNFLFLIFLFFPLLARGEGLTLQQCYDLALKQSEQVALNQELVREIDATSQRVLGSVMPKISVEGTEFLQKKVTASEGTNNTFTRFSRPELALTLTQPLFQGFKEFIALKAVKSSKEASQYRVEDAKRLLFLDVSRAFFAVLNWEQDLKTIQEIVGVNHSRLGELNEREKLGKNRSSDISQQQTDYALLLGEAEDIKENLALAKETLSFLTGLENIPRLIDRRDPIVQEDLDDYLARLENRPDLKAAEKDVESAKSHYKVQRGYFFPSADVSGNYYPYRVGFYEDIDWDVLFRVSVPLFNLETVGAYREAKSQARQSEILFKEKKRQIATDIRKAFESYKRSIARKQTYGRAVEASKRNFYLHNQDYKNGLTNTLEILEAQRSWLEAQRNFNQASYDERLNWLALRIEAGDIP